MFEIVPHTADVRLRMEHATIEGLFEDAGRALIAFIEVELDEESCTRTITVESVDRTSLLIDFLSELLATLHVERLAFDGFENASVGESRIECLARFRRARSWGEDVKAVTYHEADVVRIGELWTTVVVLDI